MNPPAAKKRRAALLPGLVILLGLACLAHADAELSRPATAADMAGLWQLEMLPPSLKPRLLATDPWPAPCQWFGYLANGSVYELSQAKAPCAPYNAASLKVALLTQPSDRVWAYLPPGILVMHQTSIHGAAEGWAAAIVTRDYEREGFAFKVGDMLLYLRDLRDHQTLYMRHLRRVGAAF